MTAIVLLILGFLLIFLEFYLPGAVFGIIGGVVLFSSVVVFAINTQSVLWTAAYVIAIGISLGFLIKFALWRIRTAKPRYSIYSNADQKGYQASSFDASVIGKKAVVVTDLKPGGHILIDGKRLQAISQSGYLPKGTEVLILSGQEESLIVKTVKEQHHE